jgi:hypothetical protein
MAGFSIQVEYADDLVNQLTTMIPEINGGFLAYLANRSKEVLIRKYLSGQELDYKSFGTDSIGRNLISWDVNRDRNEVEIWSYPLNFFEDGRKLRDGSREAGKGILTRKLKQDIASGLGSYISDYERRIQKDFNKL